MNCDLCDNPMENHGGFLGTKEVVTSQDCWSIYLKKVISDGRLDLETIKTGLSGLVGMMGSMESGFALCNGCSEKVAQAGHLPLHNLEIINNSNRAICRSRGHLVFEVLDQKGMEDAQTAAEAALNEITKKAGKKLTSWKNLNVEFQINNLDECIGLKDGLVPFRVARSDSAYGEVVLIVRDRTSFFEEFKNLNPFRLLMDNGLIKTVNGPVVYFLFYVEDPKNPKKYLCLWEWYPIITEKYFIEIIQDLSKQSHWHLLLFGQGSASERVIEFENYFELEPIIKAIQKCSFANNKDDYMRGVLEVQSKYSLDELFHFGNRTYREI